MKEHIEDQIAIPSTNRAGVTPHAYIVMSLGFWGRGKTLKEAAQNCHKAGSAKSERAIARLIVGDEKPTFDGSYIVRSPESENFRIGNGFKLQALLNLED